MEHNDGQNSEDEKGAAREITEAATSAAPETTKVSKKAAAASRDHGEWKYKPWGGLDHWVHERTGDTTFDLRKIQ
ncbi:hypothetical protein GR212_15340 [Rhizobium lusitanum]|uniref:Uncharacterized protein n=1 Tax=Rhizobium lusitanum TaxID=293958 RepID=A0A6L9UA27_9HYPH|nr:hypothetical protein [Rhizobium lusitanum]NEI70957.1 hypothetical protein [Rhizobium lusitanum]